MSRRFSAINNINNNINVVVDPTTQPMYVVHEVEVENADMYGKAECGNFLVDDEEAARLALSRALGQPEPVLYDDPTNDDVSTPMELTNTDIEALDYYYKVKHLKNNHPLTKKWAHIKYMRDIWLSQAIEETEWVYLPVDAWDHMISLRLAVLEIAGKEPTDEQWEKAMEIRSKRMKGVVNTYVCKKTGMIKNDWRGVQGPTRLSRCNDRVNAAWNHWTYWKDQGQKFWDGEDGYKFDILRAQVTEAWKMVERCGADHKRSLYWKLRRDADVNLNNIYGIIDDDCDNPVATKRDPKEELSLNEDSEGLEWDGQNATISNEDYANIW